ncbi:MAG: type II CAAX prenyl endopeptidase Rce1 family protein [Spirochaetota bacterium]
MRQVSLPKLRESLRGRTVELVAAATTAAGKFVLADWLGLQLEFTVGAIAFWVIYVVLRHKANPTVLQRWGFRRGRLREAALWSGLALLGGGGFCVVYALVAGGAIVNWNLALTLLLYPSWGLIQQFLLVALLADNVMALRRERTPEFVVVMFSALIFSAIHFPETDLMTATFFLGAATTLIFFRTRNLWAVGVLHGWFASLFYFLVMGHDPLEPLLRAAFG